MSISREAFLQAQYQTKTVEIPALGGSVTVRELGSHEVTEFYKAQETSIANGVSYILRTAAQDDAGTPLFTEADAEALSKRPFKLTNPVVDAVLRLSGLREDSAEKK